VARGRFEYFAGYLFLLTDSAEAIVRQKEKDTQGVFFFLVHHYERKLNRKVLTCAFIFE